MLQPDTPAKCCSYCGSREHYYEDCPKRKAEAERRQDEHAWAGIFKPTNGLNQVVEAKRRARQAISK